MMYTWLTYIIYIFVGGQYAHLWCWNQRFRSMIFSCLMCVRTGLTKTLGKFDGNDGTICPKNYRNDGNYQLGNIFLQNHDWVMMVILVYDCPEKSCGRSVHEVHKKSAWGQIWLSPKIHRKLWDLPPHVFGVSTVFHTFSLGSTGPQAVCLCVLPRFLKPLLSVDQLHGIQHLEILSRVLSPVANDNPEKEQQNNTHVECRCVWSPGFFRPPSSNQTWQCTIPHL